MSKITVIDVGLQSMVALQPWGHSHEDALAEALRLKCKDTDAVGHCPDCLRAMSERFDFGMIDDHGLCAECLYLYATTGNRRCTYTEEAT